MAIVTHPLADEWTDTYRVRAVEHSHVVLSRPLRHFLADCRADRVSAILLTRADAVLSPLLHKALLDQGAYWVVRKDGQLFDAFTRREISSFTALWGPSGGVRQPTLDERESWRSSGH